jgi:hypothetical protein
VGCVACVGCVGCWGCRRRGGRVPVGQAHAHLCLCVYVCVLEGIRQSVYIIVDSR